MSDVKKCTNCANLLITEPMGEWKCKLKDHDVLSPTVYIPEGKSAGDGMVETSPNVWEDCTDWVKTTNTTTAAVPELKIESGY